MVLSQRSSRQSVDVVAKMTAGFSLALSLALTILVLAEIVDGDDHASGRLDYSTPALTTAVAGATPTIGTPVASPIAGSGTPVAHSAVGSPGITAVATQRPVLPSYPGMTVSSHVVEAGPGTRREIALTFDAGSDRGNAEAILDYLAHRDITASFGMTGIWAQDNPDLVRRMVAEGHMLFNHTWSHGSFTGRSTGDGDPGTAFRIEEITRTHDLVMEIAAYDMRPYFRPAYGDIGPQSLRDIAAAGYGVTLMWTVDSFGWEEGMSGEEVAEIVLANAEPGGIILMHVGGSAVDFEALPAIIDGLVAEGFAFVTVERILQP